MPTWLVIHDVLAGRWRVQIEDQSSQRPNDDVLIRRQTSTIAELDPLAPASASIRGHYHATVSRPNNTVEGRASVLLQGSPTHIHATIDLEVRINDACHATKRWAESVPRQLL
jgi:hypothetical protein